MIWIGGATLTLIACIAYDWANGWRTELTFWYCTAGFGVGLVAYGLGAGTKLTFWYSTAGFGIGLAVTLLGSVMRENQ